jgi:hypothetical protein
MFATSTAEQVIELGRTAGVTEIDKSEKVSKK